MLSRWVVRIGLALIVFLLTAYMAIVYHGKWYFRPQTCTWISLAKGLTIRDRENISRPYDWPDRLVFRRQPGSPERVLVTAQSLPEDIPPQPSSFAEQKYSVRLSEPEVAAPISETIWNDGIDLPDLSNQALTTAAVIEYQIRPTGHSGWALSGRDSSPADIAVSPDNRYALAASYTAFYRIQMIGNAPDHGLSFWDLLDVSDRHKRLTLRAIFFGALLGGAGRAQWLNSNTFIIQREDETAGFFLCQVPPPGTITRNPLKDKPNDFQIYAPLWPAHLTGFRRNGSC